MVLNDQAARLLAEETEPFLDRTDDLRSAKRPWRRWIDAELGLRNYWYPAALSAHLPEGGSRAVRLLGEEILLVRQGGRVYAVEDRCPHRGVRFSKRPLCYSRDTITCWYHTFTFNLDDGKLRCVLNEPDCALVDKVSIRTYPVEEAKGAIFVFVGDIEPPQLKCDVPPGFLDSDMAICVTEPYEIKANWRLACENGFDPGHHFVHNWSRFTLDSGLPVTMGMVGKKEKRRQVMEFSADEPGPQGFTRRISNFELIFDATIPGRAPGQDVKVTLPFSVGKTTEDLKAILGQMTGQMKLTVGLWLPCGLRVESFPFPDVTHYEWYVPTDEKSHLYFQFGGKRVATAKEAEDWITRDGHVHWEVQCPMGFTTEDVLARESMQKFYAEEGGWYTERLYGPDVEITMWRKFASEHARGIQPKN